MFEVKYRHLTNGHINTAAQNVLLINKWLISCLDKQVDIPAFSYSDEAISVSMVMFRFMFTFRSPPQLS